MLHKRVRVLDFKTHNRGWILNQTAHHSFSSVNTRAYTKGSILLFVCKALFLFSIS